VESRKQGGVPAYAIEEMRRINVPMTHPMPSEERGAMRRKLIDALNDPDAIPQREALQAALDELDAALPPDTREAGLREALDSLRRTLGAEAYARRTGGPGQMTYLDIEHGISVLSNVIAALAATPRPGLDPLNDGTTVRVTTRSGYLAARQAGTEADRE